MLALASLCTKDRLPYARVLAASFLEHHPGADVTLLLVDAPDGCFDPADEPFEVLGIHDLGLGDQAHELMLRYEPFELAMALKPHLLRHELDRHERVVYSDTDVLIHAPLDTLAEALRSSEIVLTPHFLDPVEMDGLAPSEPQIIRAGAFNAGIVGVRRGEQADRFLTWWSQRLRSGSRVDLEHGMFVDQHWLDLVPGMFGPAVHLLADRGTNVAYWNVSERPLADDDGLTAGGAPLRCMHFSGFDPEHPEQLSVYGTRAVTGDDPILDRLCLAYAEALEAAGLRSARSWPYSWARTASGVTLTPALRELLDLLGGPGASLFDIAGERAWQEWLTEPAPESSDAVKLTRLLAGIADLPEIRDEVRPQLPVVEDDGAALEDWIKEHGAQRLGLPDSWLTSVAAVTARPQVRDVRDAAGVGAHRGEALVVIPLYGARDLFVRCLRSVLGHTSRSVRILIADDADPDPANREFVDELAASGALEHEILWLRQDANAGYVDNVNAAFAVSAPADVVLLNSDCIVAAGWAEGLRAAAYDDTNVATATALTNHGTIVSVPARNTPLPDLPQDVDFAAAARGVRSFSQRLRPRIPTCVGHCFYVRRDALELIGPFDPAFGPAYGEEVDFSQRCLVHGLVHVVADDVLVLHRQGGSLSEDGQANPIQARHESLIAARYPYYERFTRATGEDTGGTLARALSNARRGMGALTVTIDGRSLGPVLTGTQLHIVELIGAVARTGEVGLRVIVPDEIGDYARPALAMPGVSTITQHELHPGMERTSVMHRPFQVAHPDDLLFMSWAGERAIITQQDLIAYRNPGYFPAFPQFQRYRRLARAALSFADAVVFFSHHAARDAAAEEFVDPHRSHVIYIGVDHCTFPQRPEPRPPAGCEDLGERDVLLCLGTDFRHKNRLFALRIVDELQRRHDWQGRLVLAGARILHGSSRGDEAAFMATRPRLAEAVISLPAVDEAEKSWLYERADALLYPTLYEGFGLMPFEAAEYDTPALWAPQASLAEILPVETAALVPWDVEACADATLSVLRDPARAAGLLADVRQAGHRFRWDSAGRELVGVYRDTIASPVRASRIVAAELRDIDVELRELQRKYHEVLNGFTADGVRLVGAGGLLDQEEQRVLRAALERGGAANATFARALSLARRVRPGTVDDPPDADPEELRLHWAWLNRTHAAVEAVDPDPLVLVPELG